MVKRQNPSWGNKIVGSGQVHCVRRLGLSSEEWESVTPEGPARMVFAGERHVTCVKMSPEHADEVSLRSPFSVNTFRVWKLMAKGGSIVRKALDVIVLDI